MTKAGAGACPGSRAPAVQIEEAVANHIRTIGKDPSVLLATIAAARQARQAQEPSLVAEDRRLVGDHKRLAEQRRNLLDALQNGGPAANSIAGRLAEVDEQLGKLGAWHAEVTAELAELANDAVDEDALRSALERFTPVWDELLPKERHRLLRLLIEEVRYDGQEGEIEIRFRDAGIRALGREIGDRRTA